jgi:hypothetical protein
MQQMQGIAKTNIPHKITQKRVVQNNVSEEAERSLAFQHEKNKGRYSSAEMAVYQAV